MGAYNGGMNTIETECQFCKKPLIRRVAPSIKVKLHFCDNVCKGEWQKLQKPVTRDWLYEQYVTKGLDCTQIAHMVGRDPKSVWSWLKGFEIPTRKRGHAGARTQFKKGEKSRFAGCKHTDEYKQRMSDYAKSIGRVPYDPAVGSYMKGRRGADCPSWKGGITPERQAFYMTEEWKKAARAVKKRDKLMCQRCGMVKIPGDGKRFDIHHIVPFECVELRAEVSNLVYLCERCHYWVHSPDNVNKDFVQEVSSG